MKRERRLKRTVHINCFSDLALMLLIVIAITLHEIKMSELQSIAVRWLWLQVRDMITRVRSSNSKSSSKRERSSSRSYGEEYDDGQRSC